MNLKLYLLALTLVLTAMLGGVADAKGLRMRGGGVLGSRNSLGRRSRKPWSGRGRRLPPGSTGRNLGKGMGYDDSDACVGLCHYMRILEMAEKKRKATLADPEQLRKSQTTPKPVKIPYKKPYPWERTSTEAPCVGLCYFYRKNGMENPHQEWFDSWQT